MAEPGALQGALGAVVGEAAVRAGSETDAVHGVVPEVVVTPADGAGVAAVLALCTAEGWAVEPVGGGARSDWGRPPRRVDVLLSCAGLDGIEAYEPADLVVTAGAGVTLGRLRARLAEHNQWLPLDAPGGDACSVGATFALGHGGTLAGVLGGPRDLALGLEVATGDGRLLQLGGRVVKNVAGYDLVRLLVGSRGTLGVITRVHLRLRPLPVADETLTFAADGPDVAVAAALAVRAAVPAVAVELLGRGAVGFVLDEGADGPDEARLQVLARRCQLAVRLHGNEPAVAELARRARAAAEGAGAVFAPLGGAGGALPDARDFWLSLTDLDADAAVHVRVAGPSAQLAETLDVAEGLGLRGGTAAHVLTGVVRVWGEAPPNLAAVLTRAREALADIGVRVTVARAPAALAADLPLWAELGPAHRLMAGLRAQFDPAGILCAGRWVV